MLPTDPDIRRLMAIRAIKSGLLRLKWLAAATRFEIAMRRHDRALRHALKFNPDQPRVPRGSPDGGQWTGEGSGGGQTGGLRRINVAPFQYSPSEDGYHHYNSGPNVVCPANMQCSREEIADQLARYSVPGLDPAKPVENGQIHPIYDPDTGLYVGKVQTSISEDGLTITNKTQPGHIFHDGMITRRATKVADGSWQVTTEGIGNNVVYGMSDVNQVVGPDIFDGLDRQMRANIERHHTKGHLVADGRGAHHRHPPVFRLGMGGKIYVAS